MYETFKLFDFDTVRKSEFGDLDESNQVYLDFTGAGLIPSSLIQQQLDFLRGKTFGNPHSINPSSKLSTEGVEQARSRILKFFNASSKQYSVIFTSNASNAIKLVAESFPFTEASTLGILADNHNSVLGIREYASSKGASVKYASINYRLRADNVYSFLEKERVNRKAKNLFAYPAQSNFSGVRHSLSYVHHAKQHGWYVLLDAAAYVPTSNLDLSRVSPDFVPISFYKMFGLPTGVGALIVRNSALKQLRRPWFAGGTVQYSSVGTGVHVFAPGTEAFEDGTLKYLNIALVSKGLDFIESIGMNNISDHIFYITKNLLQGMDKLRYNGSAQPMVRVYGPMNLKERGGSVAFDLLASDGRRRDEEKVVEAASKIGISIRGGCFCNPGAGEKALNRDFQKEEKCLSRLQGGNKVNKKHMTKCLKAAIGCVRVSVGIATNLSDIDRFLTFIQQYSDQFEQYHKK